MNGQSSGFGTPGTESFTWSPPLYRRTELPIAWTTKTDDLIQRVPSPPGHAADGLQREEIRIGQEEWALLYLARHGIRACQG